MVVVSGSSASYALRDQCILIFLREQIKILSEDKAIDKEKVSKSVIEEVEVSSLLQDEILDVKLDESVENINNNIKKS